LISDRKSSGGIGGKDVYDSKEKKSVLALLSELYSEIDTILVSTSEYSSCLILYYLLTTFSTNYYLNQIINYFVLRKMFYTRLHFKSHHCSPM